MTNYRRIYETADVKCKTWTQYYQLKHYIEHDVELKNLEEHWIDTYFQPVAVFMGSDDVLSDTFKQEKPQNAKSFKIVHAGKGRNSSIPADQRDKFMLYAPRIVGTSGEGHYVSRLPDSVWNNRGSNNYNGPNKTFDPYDHYQIDGSNQFCQTYALMYLLGKVTYNNKKITTDFPKFYQYTTKALNFIEYVLKFYEDTEYVKSIKECVRMLKRHPYMCLNCVG
jgi:hypothetical protein